MDSSANKLAAEWQLLYNSSFWGACDEESIGVSFFLHFLFPLFKGGHGVAERDFSIIKKWDQLDPEAVQFFAFSALINNDA